MEAVPSSNTFSQYDKIGQIYIEKQREFSKGGENPVQNYFNSIIKPIIQGSVLLDVGCGAGDELEIYKGLGAAGVIGVEPSAVMRGASPEYADETIQVIDGTFDKIPVPDSSVDVVTARYALHILADFSPAFAEVARVLKPDGIFIISVSHPDFDKYIVIKHGKEVGDTISLKLFGGSVTLDNATHTMSEYVDKSSTYYFKVLDTQSYAFNQNDATLLTDLVVVYRKI